FRSDIPIDQITSPSWQPEFLGNLDPAHFRWLDSVRRLACCLTAGIVLIGGGSRRRAGHRMLPLSRNRLNPALMLHPPGFKILVAHIIELRNTYSDPRPFSRPCQPAS